MSAAQRPRTWWRLPARDARFVRRGAEFKWTALVLPSDVDCTDMGDEAFEAEIHAADLLHNDTCSDAEFAHLLRVEGHKESKS